MSTSVGSLTQYSANIQVQRTAQDLQKGLVEQLLPQPVEQSSGSDSATFSSEGLARLQAEEQAKASGTC